MLTIRGGSHFSFLKRELFCYYPLQVDSKKREHDMMFLLVYLEGFFLWPKKDKPLKPIQRG
ncbi:hypothetical protein M3655_18355, partial [Cytobacillus oceanisediminis]|nr:hypothetical protein [Cytobacillus oceanisediminis]